VCRLYAFRSTEDTKVECTLVHSQNALMTQSEQDRAGLSHRHGWGIVTYDGSPAEDRQAWAAYHGEHFRRAAAKAYATVVLAHVRRATVGEPALENTHPFKYRNWSFAHNGTIPSFAQIKPFILAEIDENHRQLIRGQRRVVGTTLDWLKESDVTSKPGLNLILTDGATIAGSRLGRTLFYVKRSGVYDCEICGFPHIHHNPDRDYRAVVVASEPLTNEQWVPFPDSCTWQVDNNAEISIDNRPFTER